MPTLFLAVPRSLSDAILQDGYQPQSRSTVHCSRTPASAILAFRRKHRGPAMCLCFDTEAGDLVEDAGPALVVHTAHVPAARLRPVLEQAVLPTLPGPSQEVFLAVPVQDRSAILRHGYRPRHRSSVPVALSPNAAQAALSRKLGSSVNIAVLTVDVALVAARGGAVCPRADGAEILLADDTDRLPPQTLAVVDPAGGIPDPPVGVQSDQVDGQGDAAGPPGGAAEPPTDTLDPAMIPAEPQYEFPRILAGRQMLVLLKPAVLADHEAWTMAQVLEGGQSRAEVKVQVPQEGLGCLGVFRTTRLNDPCVVDFIPPDQCCPEARCVLMAAEVERLHACLKDDGTVSNLPAALPKPVADYRTAETHYSLMVDLGTAQAPENGPVAFWRQLWAQFRTSPAKQHAPPAAGAPVRQFAVFQCPRCPGSLMTHFDVQSTPDAPVGADVRVQPLPHSLSRPHSFFCIFL